MANYDAVIYEDGAEAAKGLEQDHAYDLALLDVMVPGMDGFTLLPIVAGVWNSGYLPDSER